MLSIKMKRNAFRVLATLAFAAAPAFATLIPINNFSFETLPAGGLPFTDCGTGCSYSKAAIPGWGGTATINAPLGQMQPGTTAGLFTSLDLGPTSAYSNGVTLTQTVGPTVGAGTVYTLLVDIGQRADSGPFGGSADLLIGGVACATCTAGFTSGPPVSGGWATYMVTYQGTVADAGKSITIELKSVGVVDNITHQGNFDNVRLEVPEPASFLLIGSALLALKAFRRRRPIA